MESVVVLVHQVDEPLPFGVLAPAAAGVDQGELLGPAQAAALGTRQRRDDLAAVDPLFQFVGAVIPDGDLAGAVLAFGNGALKGGVVQGMVLGLDRQVVLAAGFRDALRQRPRHQHPLVLQPEIEVQPAGVVLLDHKGVPASGGAGERFGRRIRIPHRAVPLQALVRAAVVRYLFGAPGMPATVLDGGERVLAVLHPAHHGFVVEVLEVGGAELPPGPRRGHHGGGPAAERIRHDGGFGRAVLAPVHQDLAFAQGLFHVADGEVRVVGFQGAGQFVGERRDLVGGLGPVQAGVEVDAFAAAGHRDGVQAHVLQDGAGQERHFHAFGQACAVAGVQVQHQAVRVQLLAVGVHLPLGHMDFQRVDLAKPGERGGIVDQRVEDGPVLVRDGGARKPARAQSPRGSSGKTPRRACSAVPTPLTQRFRVAGRLAAAGMRTWATAA